jgi:predicted amidohydrolase YtcJ
VVNAQVLTTDPVCPAAWAGGTESVEGSISPGNLANFVVLSAVPTTVAPEHLREVLVEETWVDGAGVYGRGAASSRHHSR